MSVINTAVFPVAGLGTRFLPITKAAPKEMLPIVDKPLMQYVVEEALAAGIKQLVFVTSTAKHAIEDYFDSNFELEQRLRERNKHAALQTLQNIVPKDISIVYVRQPEPLGLGDAVLRAKHIVGNHPFAVMLADDIMELGARACLQEMVEIYQQTQGSVLAVEEIDRSETDKYGIVSLATHQANRVSAIVEKPRPEEAKSNLAVTGRYILTPQIFSLLEQTSAGVGGELQLTDAIAKALNTEHILYLPHPRPPLRLW